MSSPDQRALPGVFVLWLVECLTAISWISLLWWQKESGGLTFGVLGLGLCLAPLHVLRLLKPQQGWTWLSFAWEILVLALVRLGVSSALPLGYLLALALYAVFPADARPAGHSRWRWMTRVPLVLTLASIAALDYWPQPSAAAIPWLLLAAESESGPAPRPHLALARASGALTLLALVSQVDTSAAMNQLVTFSFGYVALERYWRSDGDILPRPGSLIPVRLLALGLYFYSLPDALAIRIGCAFFVTAGCFVRWSATPRKAAGVAALLVVALAGLEVIAWQARPEGPPLSNAKSSSLSLEDYLSRIGTPELRDADPGLRVLQLRGQEYQFQARAGYRLQEGHAPSESGPAEVSSWVVVLGDEAAFGLGVSGDQSSSVRLKEALKTQRPTTVSNFGVIGANSQVAFALAHRLEGGPAPDEIVWLLRSDDLLTGSCKTPYQTSDAWSFPFLRRLTAPALERTHLGVLFSRPYDALLRHLGLRTDYFGDLTAPESQPCYLFATRLHEFCDLRRKEGRSAPLVVVLPGYQSPAPQRTACLRLELASEAAGARVVRVPGLADDARAWLEWAPQLPSPQGHSKIAAALARELQAPR